MCAASETASSSRQGQRTDEPYRAREQHVATADQPPGAQDVVVLEKVENHSGAIWYFVHHDNVSLA